MSLKENASNTRTKKLLFETRNSVGSNINSPADIPRNYNQAAYARRMISKPFQSLSGNQDRLFNMIYKCKSPSDDFVQEVKTAPELIAVLCTKIQLNDLVRFCCQPEREESEVLSIDFTFLGDFCATILSFKNKMLVNKNGNHPIHIGAIQVQHRKLLQSYKYFAATLSRLNPEFKNLKVFGSDDESNIVNGFLTELNFAENLQCFRHMKKNVKYRMKGWSKQDVTKIIDDIFGDKFSEPITYGLLDSETLDEYDQAPEDKRVKWNELERKYTNSSKLSLLDWIMDEKSEIMKRSMIKLVRERNGIPAKMDSCGNSYIAEYTTNAVESSNSQIKSWTEGKVPIDVFIEQMREFIKNQENQYVQAVSRTGDVAFSPRYKSLELGSE